MEWKEVREFPGYQASSDGRILGKHGRVLRPTNDRQGYARVAVMRDSKPYNRKVATLVALAFHGPRPEGMVVRHLNGDNTDNRAGNLKYGTSGENHLDAVAHGTHHNARKTHCKRDHEFTPENTYIRRNGSRFCRTCGLMRRAK